MLKSMTGFGRCLLENSDMTQQWEIRSVNSRYLDIKWRLPNFVHGLEPQLEKIVKSHAKRGRVEIMLFLTFSPSCNFTMDFNASQANAMIEKISQFAALRNDTFQPDYSRLLSIPALWKEGNEELDELFVPLKEGLELALDDWNEGRSAEGSVLLQDLSSRILKMEEWLHTIGEQAPSIKEENIQAMRERVSESLEALESELDESRFLQEIVLLSDRLDVTEEIVRLSTHLERLRELLHMGEDAGRRLDFTLQECFREINTCGNKIANAQISRIVVDFKNELEKCREQVQNLE